MNTGELIVSYHMAGPRREHYESWEPVIFCDICGFGCCGWDDIFDEHHFCHDHSSADIETFFEKKKQLELEL